MAFGIGISARSGLGLRGDFNAYNVYARSQMMKRLLYTFLILVYSSLYLSINAHTITLDYTVLSDQLILDIP